jgi:hypothetical protein
MSEGRVGDRLLVESERVGQPGREGEILAVLGGIAGAHYRVRWADGHESTFFPSGGSLKLIQTTKKARN